MDNVLIKRGSRIVITTDMFVVEIRKVTDGYTIYTNSEYTEAELEEYELDTMSNVTDAVLGNNWFDGVVYTNVKKENYREFINDIVEYYKINPRQIISTHGLREKSPENRKKIRNLSVRRWLNNGRIVDDYNYNYNYKMIFDDSTLAVEYIIGTSNGNKYRIVVGHDDNVSMSIPHDNPEYYNALTNELDENDITFYGTIPTSKHLKVIFDKLLTPFHSEHTRAISININGLEKNVFHRPIVAKYSAVKYEVSDVYHHATYKDNYTGELFNETIHLMAEHPAFGLHEYLENSIAVLEYPGISPIGISQCKDYKDGKTLIAFVFNSDEDRENYSVRDKLLNLSKIRDHLVANVYTKYSAKVDSIYSVSWIMRTIESMYNPDNEEKFIIRQSVGKLPFWYTTKYRRLAIRN